MNVFSGDSYHSLMYLFRIPVSTMSLFIPEVCVAIYEVLKDMYLKVGKFFLDLHFRPLLMKQKSEQ
jgi:hypothetical protein